MSWSIIEIQTEEQFKSYSTLHIRMEADFYWNELPDLKKITPAVWKTSSNGVIHFCDPETWWQFFFRQYFR